MECVLNTFWFIVVAAIIWWVVRAKPKPKGPSFPKFMVTVHVPQDQFVELCMDMDRQHRMEGYDPR